MTGLDLEPFLRLLRADLGVWISLGAVVAVLALMAWTSWGSRRVLRKCLVLSIAAHVGLIFYGNGLPALSGAMRGEGDSEANREHIQSIRVVGEDGRPLGDPNGANGSGDGANRALANWDRPTDLSAPQDAALRVAKPEPRDTPLPSRTAPDRLAGPDAAAPDLAVASPPRPEDSPPAVPADARPSDAPAPIAAGELPDVEPPPEAVARDTDDAPPLRVRPTSPPLAMPAREPAAPVDRPALPAPDLPTRVPSPAPPANEPVVASTLDRPAPDRVDERSLPQDPAPPRGSDAADLGGPDGDLRAAVRGGRASAMPGRVRPAMEPVTIARADSGRSVGPALPAPISRPVNDVPEVYRERIAPDRANRARLAGASLESEAAVERALDWLARHQDADGRWNAGTKKRARGGDAPAAGEVNFTRHCPPGDPCEGECYYYEADSAMTGLALLAYLGAGYTHDAKDGKYAAEVARGLQYLLRIQKPDGDLRGESVAVGMYCHAMATLALCEAYALSGDERLRGPSERAVGFLARARAADGLSWRYKPGEPTGDTSLLGWAILVFKSAEAMEIPVSASMRAGALGWLNLVAEGKYRGLAVYRPNEGPQGNGPNNPPYVPGRNMTPTMTAEAWVCRQFLGVGGPGPASDEAARYLLQNPPDRARLNLYYWYYGTLAMYRHGGADWEGWNARVRDALVALQKTSGHESGSWDPAGSRSDYDRLGGRIYCTALATMTLEVYYRYGKTDGPKSPPAMSPRPDPTLRRAGEAAGRR